MNTGISKKLYILFDIFYQRILRQYFSRLENSTHTTELMYRNNTENIQKKLKCVYDKTVSWSKKTLQHVVLKTPKC